MLVLAVVIAGFAAVAGDALAAVVTAGLAWPFYLGFLVDRYGELHWHGRIDLLRLAVLAVASLIGTAVGDWVTSGRGPTSRLPYLGQNLGQTNEARRLGDRGNVEPPR